MSVLVFALYLQYAIIYFGCSQILFLVCFIMIFVILVNVLSGG